MPNHDADFSLEKVSELLRREGLRMTKKREGILRALFEAKAPMSLQEIQTAAGTHSPAMPDYATVFRTILLMEKLRLIHKVNLQRSRSHYELSDPHKHYDHLVCRECGEVVLIDIPCPIGDAEKTIARQYGFRDLSHSLEFFGVCSTCSK
ncbi:MAG: Fur family transcriptional regulator [Terrimicrobiaceae bacterium]